MVLLKWKNDKIIEINKGVIKMKKIQSVQIPHHSELLKLDEKNSLFIS